MITYKPIIIPGGRRKDGTWPVKIRVTFKGKVRRLHTTLVCTEADVTRSGRIKNATIIHKADELIARMRATTADLSPFTLDAWDVDRVVDHIRAAMTAQDFRLPFIAFGRRVAATKGDGTRRCYEGSLNAFARFLGGEDIDVNDVSRTLLTDFRDWCNTTARVVHTSRGIVETDRPLVKDSNAYLHLRRLAYLYQQAKAQYNDEDTGRILIPRSPFSGVAVGKPVHDGQRSVGVETMQRILDAVPSSRSEAVALAVFVLSFATMGANLADLYAARPFEGRFWRYNRAKTSGRRADRAEVVVRISPKLEGIVATLQEDGPTGWWLPALHRWKWKDSATRAVNFHLRKWAQREGVEPFTFYAARHTFASLCRRVGVEKATIDEALAHVGEFRIADIYAERNWSLAWDATDKVLDLLRWKD